MAQTILTRAELEAHDPEGGRNGRWLCPLVNGICEHKTDPKDDRSLHLDEATGLWKCFRCGSGGQIKERWKPMEPRRSWEDRKAEARRQRERRRAAAIAIVTSATPQESAGALFVFRLGSLCHTDGTPGAVYLAGRGIGPELLRAAGVRFAVDFGRRPAEEGRAAWSGGAAVVFPIRGQGGKLVAAQGRFIAPRGDGPKMLTIGPKSAGVFATPGALDTPGPVAVVEAPIDALSLAAAGLPAVALCGTSGAPRWILHRLAWRQVLLAFDADEPKDGKPGAGDAAAEAFAQELARVSLGMAKPGRLRPHGAKDWNELLTDRGLEAVQAQVAAGVRKVGGFRSSRREATNSAARRVSDDPEKGNRRPPAPSAPSPAAEATATPPAAAPSEPRRPYVVRGRPKPPEIGSERERADKASRSPKDGPTGALGTDVPPEDRGAAAHGPGEPIGEEERADQDRVEQQLRAAWLALREDRLPSGGFDFARGRRCANPGTWLCAAVRRRRRLVEIHGPHWWDTADGQLLALDLRAFADWWASVSA